MTTPVSSSLPSTVPDRAAAPAASTGSAASAAAGAGAGSDSVEISDQADAASTMLSAAQDASAQDASAGATNPALATIAQEIADGIYKPPPEAIAEALVRYETRLLQGG